MCVSVLAHVMSYGPSRAKQWWKVCVLECVVVKRKLDALVSWCSMPIWRTKCVGSRGLRVPLSC